MPEVRRIRSKAHWRVRTLSLGATLAALLAACNLIVGVRDVKLRKDSGTGRDGDIEGPPIEGEEGGVEPSRFVELALGKTHGCAKRRTGQVKCWGDDSAGQTGTGGNLGGTTEAGTKYLPTASPVENVNALTVASGGQHTCFVQLDGAVSCWGANVSGQLGSGNTTPQASATPARNMVDAVALAGGTSHTCALRRTGQVACWGANGTGQLGIGNFTPSPLPVAVTDLTAIKALALGQSHSCAVTTTGEVFCWGENFNGQLGLPGGGREALPRKTTITGAIAIAATNDSTCAILETGGTVVCWGKEDSGQTGKGVAVAGRGNHVPVAVPGVGGATQIVGGSEHFCAVTGQNVVFCWGDNRVGQLGFGATGDASPAPIGKPTAVAGIVAASVGAGGDHSCASNAEEKVFCWGDNTRGELGDGTSKRFSAVPVSVVGLP